MKAEIEDNQDMTIHAVEIRNQREQEMTLLKKQNEDSQKAHEQDMQVLKQKYSQQVEQLNEELENFKKVKKKCCYTCCCHSWFIYSIV